MLRIGSLLITVLAFGCGDGGAVRDLTAADLAAPADLARPLDLAAPPDSATPPIDLHRIGCATLLTCLSGCMNDEVCNESCLSNASAQAGLMLGLLISCAGRACPNVAPDGGVAPCAVESSPACNECRSRALLLPSGACFIEYQSCQNHKP